MPQHRDPFSDPPGPAEAAIRAEIEGEVREEYARRERDAADRDKRMLALSITLIFVVGCAIPLLGLVVGAAVRLFRWASGL